MLKCHSFLFFASLRRFYAAVCQGEVNFVLSRERQALAVYLEERHLPPVLELSLNDKQAALKNDYSEEGFQVGLSSDLSASTWSEVKTRIESEQTPAKSIAVLPLANRGNESDAAYLLSNTREIDQ